METWVFGAILTLVGFLVIVGGIAQEGYSLVFLASGISFVTVGLIIFVNRFKKWIESL